MANGAIGPNTRNARVHAAAASLYPAESVTIPGKVAEESIQGFAAFSSFCPFCFKGQKMREHSVWASVFVIAFVASKSARSMSQASEPSSAPNSTMKRIGATSTTGCRTLTAVSGH